MKNRKTIILLMAVWLLLLSGGFGYLVYYQFKAGETGPGVAHVNQGIAQLMAIDVSSQLTSDLSERIGAETGKPIAVVFLHPHCPCSQATVAMIERSLSTLPNEQYEIMFIHYVSMDHDQQWNNSALIRKVHSIPRVTVIPDPHSHIAAAFGARISGEVLAFDSSGTRAYHGGVTNSRGHEGANPGIEAMEAVLRGETPELAELPTYGCVLTEQTETTLDAHNHH